jgi:hypothetical protein
MLSTKLNDITKSSSLHAYLYSFVILYVFETSQAGAVIRLARHVGLGTQAFRPRLGNHLAMASSYRVNPFATGVDSPMCAWVLSQSVIASTKAVI